MKLENTWQTSGLEKLISYIIKAANQPEILDDLNYATDATWSSNKIKTVLDQLKLDIDSDIDDVAKALSKIKIELVTVEPTNDNTVSGTIYIYQNTTDNKYYQYLRTETVLVNLGEASADLTKYYTKTDADAKFALASDLTTTNTEVAKKLNKTSVIASTDTTTSAGEDNVYSAFKVDKLLDDINCNSIEIANGTSKNASIIPWNDGTHLRSSKKDDDSSYDDLILNDGKLIVRKVESGTVTFSKYVASINDTTASNETVYSSEKIDTLMHTAKTLTATEANAMMGYTNFVVTSSTATTLGLPANPSSSWFITHMSPKSGYTFPTQVAYEDSGSKRIMYRTCSNGTWSSWIAISTMDKISNPNLLDNPWFTVNQRGQTSYSGSMYTVDRWRIYGADTTFNITDDGVSIDRTNATTTSTTSGFRQKFEKNLQKDKTYTFSALIKVDKSSDTKDVVFSYVYGETFVSNKNVSLTDDGNFHLYTFTYGVTSDVNEVRIRHASAQFSNITIKAMKLELGSVSTLANDIAPNYAEELRKCQRYYQKIASSPVGYSGYANETTSFRATLPLAVPMRTKPTLVNSSITLGECLIYTPSGASITPTAITVADWYPADGNCLQINSTVSGFTKNMCAVQRFNIDLRLSADL